MATTHVSGSQVFNIMMQGDQLSANLVSTKSLIQYLGEGNMVNPDWTVGANQPVIYPSVRSSLSTGIISDITNAKFFFDGAEILTGNPNFEITTQAIGSAGETVPALKVLKNIMLGTTSNKTIRCEFDVFTGGYTTNLSATIDVQRQVVSESTYVGEIGVNNGGVISNPIDSLTITSSLFKGGQSITAFTMEWWKVVAVDTDGTPDGLMDTGLKTKTITRGVNDINLMTTLVAKFFVEGSLVATASVDIHDYTDPIEMVFENTPAGFTVPKTGLTTMPRVVRRGSTTPITEFSKFAYSLMNGPTLIRSQAKGTGSFKLEYSDFTANGTSRVRLVVETDKTW